MIIKQQIPVNLRNFLHSYTLPESSEMLNEVFDQVTESIKFAAMSENQQEEVLDFLEALEELLPAVYELQQRMKLIAN
ncbi:hypothetical protein [Daejeonella sp. JGW-45]|uniref:hypothetical protein n=1 Tax=Daejeonella sp. JGW-45 TaxID=3034148 RepID=UPI0023EE1C0D|nr:hypothetical protein [Daejeonella sp. JGW-45]